MKSEVLENGIGALMWYQALFFFGYVILGGIKPPINYAVWFGVILVPTYLVIILIVWYIIDCIREAKNNIKQKTYEK